MCPFSSHIHLGIWTAEGAWIATLMLFQVLLYKQVCADERHGLSVKTFWHHSTNNAACRAFLPPHEAPHHAGMHAGSMASEASDATGLRAPGSRRVTQSMDLSCEESAEDLGTFESPCWQSKRTRFGIAPHPGDARLSFEVPHTSSF